MNSRFYRGWFLLALASFFYGCGSDNEVEVVDIVLQFEEDKTDIQDLFSDRQIESDTVENGSGVRYGVISNNSDGEIVEQGDVVMIDYVAYTLGGNVLGTTFQSVADTSDIISTPADQLVLTHTSNGWAFNELFTSVGGAFRTNGFRDGVTALLNSSPEGQFSAGSFGLIGIPGIATVVTINGSTTRIQGIPAEVIIYEFELAGVVK